MAARDLTLDAAVRPLGGITFPAGSQIVPSAGEISFGYQYGVLYALDSAGNLIQFYMPNVFLAEQAAVGTPGAGQAFVEVTTGGIFGAMRSNSEYAALQARTQGFSPGLYLDDTAANAWLEGARKNGTDASPTKVLSGDRMFRIGAGGTDATAALRYDRATIDFEAISDWNSNTDTGTQIVLRTTADDSGSLVQGLLQKGAGHLYDRSNRRIIGRVNNGMFTPAAYLESIPRWACVAYSGMITGQVMYQLLQLEEGDIITNLSWRSIGAAATLTHQISGLYDVGTGNRVAQSSDATSAAWGANTTKTFAMSAPYTIPASGLYWAALRVSATTMPTMAGANQNTTFSSVAFAFSFHDSNTDTAATTVPATVGTKTGDGALWVGVS